jgi:hypothetical protein
MHVGQIVVFVDVPERSDIEDLGLDHHHRARGSSAIDAVDHDERLITRLEQALDEVYPADADLLDPDVGGHPAPFEVVADGRAHTVVGPEAVPETSHQDPPGHDVSTTRNAYPLISHHAR